jgi:GDP-mannose 6-dehydrogenase
MLVAVFGLGYVGTVTAACLAKLGHRVVGVDPDAYKIQAIQGGNAPFTEPGLQEIIEETCAGGQLRATSSAAEALEGAEIALICVGTPSERDGSVSLEQLRRVSDEIAELIKSRATLLIIAVRSTVFPGTCENVVAQAFPAGAPVKIVSNPEFLREGNAIRDFMEPGLIVIGGSDAESVRCVASLYDSLTIEAHFVSLRTAEMIKYACNAFHAIKVAFANEIGTLSGANGVDGSKVMEILCSDLKLNVSAAYLKPGFAFGGSCLPKDIRALLHCARMGDLRLPLIESALSSNNEHLRRLILFLLDREETHIGVVGLAFKESTDDVRESPVIALLEVLIGKGREVRLFDPQIKLDKIYGANRSFLLNAIPHIGRLMRPTLEELLEWADLVVVTQLIPPIVAEALRVSGLPILDLCRVRHSGAAGVRPEMAKSRFSDHHHPI